MSGTGTRETGFATADLGPFHCRNCRKWKSEVCLDAGVAADHEVPEREQRLTSDGHLQTGADECCNEFLSLKDDQGGQWKQGNVGQRLMALGL